MPKSRYARIAITLPPDLLKAADREAKRLGRSRSWVIAEALRRMVAGGGAASQPAGEPASVASRPGAVREAVVAPYLTSGERLDPSRREQLRRDMELSPTERLQASDEAVRFMELAHPGPPLRHVIFFEDYLDYLRWKTAGRLHR